MQSIIKHSYLKIQDNGIQKAQAHLRYLAFRSAQKERKFFSQDRDEISRKDVQAAMDRHQDAAGVVIHKLVLSPGRNFADITSYVREVMGTLGSKKGLNLEWYAVVHHNTDHWHAHVVVMPRDRIGLRVRFDKNDYREMKLSGDRYLWRNNLLERRNEKTRIARCPHRALHSLRQRLQFRRTTRNKGDRFDTSHLRSRHQAKEKRERKAPPTIPPKSKGNGFRGWLKQGLARLSSNQGRYKEFDKAMRELEGEQLHKDKFDRYQGHDK